MRFFAIHPLHYTTTRSSTYTHSTPTLPLTLASYDDQLQNSNRTALIPYTSKLLHHHHHHHHHSVVVRQHQQQQYPRYFSSRIDFRVPRLSPSFQSGEITHWHKEVNDTIHVNDLLVELSTNSITQDLSVEQCIEIESQEECRLIKRHHSVGDTVNADDVLCTLEFDEDMSNRTIAWQAYKKS